MRAERFSTENEDLWERGRGDAAGEAPEGREFHFSYIHNALTGKRTYSVRPESLRELGLVLDVSEPVPSDWRALIVEEDRPLYDNVIAAATKHGGPHKLCYRLRNRRGEIFHIRDYCELTRNDGQWPLLIGSVIGNETRYEKVLRAQRQALISRLSGGIVHDFRNLLTGIQNIIEWCGTRPELTEDTRKALMRTVDYTGQANTLINSLLALQNGKHAEGAPKKLSIERELRALEPLLRHVVTASTRLTLEITPGLSPIFGQKGALRDMLVNLCSNARDALKERGDAQVRIRAFPRETFDENGSRQRFAVIQVEDNGEGIPEDKKRAIFDAFYSTRPTGAGLGLWMVQEAARSFDGRVDVRGAPGEGAIFELVFPAVEGETENAPAPPVEVTTTVPVFENDNTPRTVLLIEDEPLIVSGVTACLESLGCEVLFAEDGQSGWELFHSAGERIDVVILDYVVPGKSGVELLTAIKAVRPELPVIVMSGHPDASRERETLAAGAKAFLPKPFKLEKLVELTRDATKR